MEDHRQKVRRSGNPLLVSVRSGARASMPGMMDTILNLGQTKKSLRSWRKSGNPRWAYDCYRRFIQMYLTWLWKSAKIFEQLIDKMKEERRDPGREPPLTTSKSWPASLKKNTKPKSARISPTQRAADGRDQSGIPFWDNPRANVYRRDNDIPYSGVPLLTYR
ncbi:MAG: PEP/pyruvate-binding domain-containing protein [[Clostridium] leptum]